MPQSLVSIIIPTFNRAHLIGETLDSVLFQSYSNWECIVVDDGSTDNALELLEAYRNKDSRITYHSRPIDRPKGANACRNYGFELSRGTYIQFLDSDDCISQNKIEFQMEALKQQDFKAIAICKWARFELNLKETMVQENLPYYKNMTSSKELLDVFGRHRLYMPSHAYMVHKSIVIRAGRWNEYLSINQDAEFFVRVLMEATTILYVDEALVYYRSKLNNSNVSSETSRKIVQEKIDSWKLIELYLKIRYKYEDCVYVEGAKWRYYGRFKKQFPDIIMRNKVFFEIQIKRSRIFNLILRKIKNILIR
jgi:glycosyltransferase involved in cell wall biosynthesis